jgi:exodeoxyribonuclease VII large subunit
MPEAISISQLTRSIKSNLNNKFPSVWVEGEVSGMTQASSGHVYLTLKDAGAQINAIIWRNDAEALDFDLSQGLKVICRGGVDVYPQRGTYQLIIRRVQPVGVGALQLAFKKLHAKLSADGLFDEQFKQALPPIPKHIAVVTSPTGAAVRDFLQVLLRRWPKMHVTIIPAVVQGPAAANEIAAGVRIANSLKPRPDALVVTRGGGSIEDLWSFNEEIVVRAIFNSKIPVVSGVGHEIDVTLADLVADVRALTPSEAAERLVPDMGDVQSMLRSGFERLRSAMIARFREAKTELAATASRPAITRPLTAIGQAAMELDFLEQTIKRSAANQLNEHRHSLAALAQRMHAISPLEVLSRGYSLTSDDQGNLLTDCDSIADGDKIVSRLANGRIHSVIDRIEKSS